MDKEEPKHLEKMSLPLPSSAIDYLNFDSKNR